MSESEVEEGERAAWRCSPRGAVACLQTQRCPALPPHPVTLPFTSRRCTPAVGGWGGWLPDLRWCSARQRDDGRMETGVWKAGCSVDRRGCGRRVQESGRQMWAAEPNFCLPRCGIRLPSPSHNPPSPSPAKPPTSLCARVSFREGCF